MAAVAGKFGVVSYGGATVLSIRSWDLSVTVDQLDVTSWTTGTDQWRAFKPGLSGANGTFTGFVNTTSTKMKEIITNTLTPTTAALVLEADKVTGGKYSGSALIESLNPSASIDGTADLSYSFRFTGAVTYTTTT